MTNSQHTVTAQAAAKWSLRGRLFAVGAVSGVLAWLVGAAAIYHVVKQIIIASLHGHPQPLVIEAARSGIDHKNQPGFAEVFDGLRGK